MIADHKWGTFLYVDCEPEGEKSTYYNHCISKSLCIWRNKTLNLCAENHDPTSFDKEWYLALRPPISLIYTGYLRSLKIHANISKMFIHNKVINTSPLTLYKFCFGNTQVATDRWWCTTFSSILWILCVWNSTWRWPNVAETHSGHQHTHHWFPPSSPPPQPTNQNKYLYLYMMVYLQHEF